MMRRSAIARFRLAGHDRGGRVAHRLCLDHPHAVERVAVLDISPTRTMYAQTDHGVRDGVLPLVLPDPAVRPARAADRRRSRLLPATQARRLGHRASRTSTRARSPSTSAASAIPATIHATCEDYRAAASIDLEHDADERTAQRSRVRCSCCGASAASCTGCSIRSPTGAPLPRRARASARRPATTSPRRCPTRRCAELSAFFAA